MRDSASNAATLLGEELVPAFHTRPMPLRQFAGSIGLTILGIVLLIIGALLMAEEATIGAAVWLLLGVGALVGGVLLLLARRRGNCTVTVHERGVVIDRGRAVTVAFAGIDAVSAQDNDLLSNGERFGRWRDVTLHVGPMKHRLAHFTPYGPDGETDTFVQSFAAILGGRLDSARADIAAGKSINGQGWQLAGTGLSIGRSGERIGWPEIAAADLFDGRAQVWRTQRDLPVLSVPEGSRDAYTLLSLVQDRLEGREGPVDDGVGFGRLLFRRYENRVAGWVVFGLTLVFAIPVVLGLVDAESWSATDDDFIMATAMMTLAVPLGIASFLLLWPRAEFYARGLRRRGIFGWRGIRYDAVQTMRYAETIRYHNGAYAGATVKAWFVGEAARVKITASMRKPDEDLERVRETVASLVADRMQQELDSKGRVRWVDPVWISADALEATVRKRLRDDETVRLGFDQELMFTMHNGECRVFPADQSAWLAMPAAGDNFFPGFELFARLAGKNEGEQDEVSEEA